MTLCANGKNCRNLIIPALEKLKCMRCSFPVHQSCGSGDTLDNYKCFQCLLTIPDTLQISEATGKGQPTNTNQEANKEEKESNPIAQTSAYISDNEILQDTNLSISNDVTPNNDSSTTTTTNIFTNSSPEYTPPRVDNSRLATTVTNSTPITIFTTPTTNNRRTVRSYAVEANSNSNFKEVPWEAPTFGNDNDTMDTMYTGDSNSSQATTWIHDTPWIYTRFDLRVNLKPTGPVSNINTVNKEVKSIVDELRRSNPHIQILPWFSRNENETNFLNTEALPTSHSGLKRFFPRTKITNGDTWCDVFIKHMRRFEFILDEVKSWLDDSGNGIYPKDLQVARTA